MPCQQQQQHLCWFVLYNVGLAVTWAQTMSVELCCWLHETWSASFSHWCAKSHARPSLVCHTHDGTVYNSSRQAATLQALW
jgi:hypothetical protein